MRKADAEGEAVVGAGALPDPIADDRAALMRRIADEIERLRAERDEWQATLKSIEAARQEGLDEIERLRAALRKIANDDYSREDERLTNTVPTMIWQAVARQALGEQ